MKKCALFLVLAMLLGLLQTPLAAAYAAAPPGEERTTTFETLFEDDFSADTGAWTPNSDTWTIADGVYTQSSTSGGYLTFAGNPNWTDYEVEVKVTPRASTNGIAFFVNGRATDANNRYYASYVNGKLTISRRWKSTSAKDMVTKSYSMELDRQYTIKLAFSGQKISLYVDGALELEHTDTDNAYSKGMIGLGTNRTSAEFDDVVVRGIAVPEETLTLTAPVDYQVIQRDPVQENGIVQLSGKVELGTPVTIEAQVLDYTEKTVVVGWTPVAENAVGAWSGTLTVPQGGWYVLELRAVGGDGSVLETLQSENRWGVGINILCIGQSNMVGQGKGTATVADDRVAKYNGSWVHLKDPYDGAGNSLVPAMANLLVDKLDLPIGIIPAADSGSGLHAPNIGHSANRYWMYYNVSNPFDTGTLYGKAVSRATGAGGVELAVWNQGETDGRLEISQAVYEADMRTLLSRLRTDLDNESLPIFLCQIGTHDTNISNDAAYTEIRSAQHDLDDGKDFFLAATEMEFERQDTAHYTTAGLNEIGRRVANSILYYYGASDYYRGPYIESADYADSTRQVVNVTIAHRGGSDISTQGEITGFSVLDNRTETAITSAVRLDANTIQLTLASPIAGSGSLRYLYGLNPAHSNIAKDNTAMRLPLENTTQDILIGGDQPLQPLAWDLLDSSLETGYTSEWKVSRGSAGTVTQKGGFVNILKSDSEKAEIPPSPPGPYIWLVPQATPTLPTDQPFTAEVTLRMAGETTSPALNEVSIRMGTGSNDLNGKLYPIFVQYGTQGLVSANSDGSKGYELDTTIWHNYGMVIDPVSKTYDIYVDGTRVITGAAAKIYKGGNLFRMGMDNTARGNMDIRSARLGAGDLSSLLTAAENPWPGEQPEQPAVTWDILDHKMFPDWKSDSFRSSSKTGTFTQHDGYVNILKPNDSSIDAASKYHWLISPASLALPRAGFTMETTVRVAGPVDGEANEIGIRMGSDANDTNGKIASLFLGYGEHGYISANAIGSGLYCLELDTTVWHTITTIVFPKNGSFYYDVYVDGQLAFDSVPFQTYKGGDLIRFGADNGGRCNLDVKDVRVGTGSILPDGASPAKLTGVTLSAPSQKETEEQTIAVTVTGTEFEDGAPVSIVLLDKNYAPMDIAAQGTFAGGSAVISLTIPSGLKVSSYYVQATANGRRAISGIYTVTADRPAPVFPTFTPVDYTIQLEDYLYNPTQEFNFPCVVDTKDHPVSNGWGDYRYYLFYAPHDAPAGNCVAASNSLNGPWVEYDGNPVIGKTWAMEDGSGNYYSVSHVSSPHVMWNEQHGCWFMYFHGENPTTRYATSDDLIHWTYGGVCVTANQFSPTGSGFSEASYARVYEHEVPGLGNRYIMLLMITGSGNNMHRNIYWAYSDDAINWTPVTTSLLNPDMDPQYMNNFSGPWFMEWDGRYFVICHASSGEIYAFEVGEGLDEVIPWGILYESRGQRYDSDTDDDAEWPDYGRAGAPCFIQDDDGVWHMFYEGGKRLHANIVHAVGTPIDEPEPPGPSESPEPGTTYPLPVVPEIILPPTEDVDDGDTPLGGAPHPFEDVAEDSPYHSAVQFVYEQKLFEGISETLFAPDLSMSRAMLAVVLYRAAGSPDLDHSDFALTFADVDPDAYYGEAVHWAAQTGVVKGYSSTRFAPDDSVTREQIAVLLWRMAGQPAPENAQPQFSDAGDASGYAREALAWATEAGILCGNADGLLAPRMHITRGEIAQALQAYLKQQ